jgi:formate hydrogenlyase subunit 4
MAKLMVYGAIFVALFVPWGGHLFYPLSVIVLLAKVFVLVLAVTVVAATHARYRIDQVVRYYAGLFAVSLVALVLAVLGW